MLILDKNSRDVIDGDLKMAQDTITQAIELLQKQKLTVRNFELTELLKKANHYILPTRNLLIEDRNRQMRDEHFMEGQK